MGFTSNLMLYTSNSMLSTSYSINLTSKQNIQNKIEFCLLLRVNRTFCLSRFFLNSYTTQLIPNRGCVVDVKLMSMYKTSNDSTLCHSMYCAVRNFEVTIKSMYKTSNFSMSCIRHCGLRNFDVLHFQL